MGTGEFNAGGTEPWDELASHLGEKKHSQSIQAQNSRLCAGYFDPQVRNKLYLNFSY